MSGRARPERKTSMKRMTAIALALMLAVMTMVAAVAEGSLRRMYDAGFNLLFDTENVTLAGKAEFSLDGEWFKTAEGTYRQDGNRSFWQLKTRTPKMDGTEREGGYTVVADGGVVYAMEDFYPGSYRIGTNMEQTTILRRSVQLNLVSDLVRVLADQAETLLGEKAVTVTYDEASETETVRLEVGKDVPEIVNTALNLVAQYAARRYFDMDYDAMNEKYIAPMDSYITVTQAILGSTVYYSLKEADVTLKRNAADVLQEASGQVSLLLNTGADGVRQLDVQFRLDVSDLGSTEVKPFEPEDYNVELAPGSYFYVPAQPEPEPASSIPAHDEREFPEDIGAWEAQLWTRAGYQPEDIMSRGGHCVFVEDGTLVELQDSDVPWLSMHVDGTEATFFDDQMAEEAVAEKLTDFLAFANPGMERTVDHYQLAWRCQYGDSVYAQYEGMPKDGGEEDTVTFVIQEKPEFQIQYFACISNG